MTRGDFISYDGGYMNPMQQEEKRMQDRIDAADAELEKAFVKIFKKAIPFLTIEDKRFLQARRSYLDDRQLEKYAEVLREKLERPDGQKTEEEEQVIELTRKELEAMATRIGIETPEDKKVYRTNADLQAAIKEKQAEEQKA